ncbi:hypothetical protein [Glaciihabitans sp. UYNi722]|uniref:hypothetical protein n=1 Tax=Glaciihabitans sp. UYNi722 TaxID=3156344 RepID=UPI003394D390
MQRVRSDGDEGHPLEVQLYSFPSEEAFNGYMNDERRTALAEERDRVIARTEIMRVDVT